MSGTLQRHDFGVLYKVLAVVCGAFLCGAFWRIRGESGYGSKWGMFTVVVGLAFLIFTIFGERKKLSFSLLPIFVILSGFTAGGWGTLNSQMTGFLGASTPFLGEEAVRTIEVNPWSGLLVLFCLGFGWMPFFSYFSGYFFSDKEYKFLKLMAGAAVFYVVYFLGKATFAHPITQVFFTDATQLFKDGLADRSLDVTPWGYYMQNFNLEAMAKKIPGGRNYYATVAAVAAAIATLALIIYQRFALKDKRGARINFVFNTIVMFAMTISDIPMVVGAERTVVRSDAVAKLFEGWPLWSLWEYGTGFLLGFGVLLVIMIMSKKLLSEGAEIPQAFPSLPKKADFVYQTILAFFAPLFVTTLRPFTGRLFEDGTRGYIIAFVLGLVILAVCFVISRKNMLKNNLGTPVNMDFKRFCTVSFAPYFCVNMFIYFFVSKEQRFLRGEWDPIMKLMAFSFFVVLVCFAAMLMFAGKEKSAKNKAK